MTRPWKSGPVHWPTKPSSPARVGYSFWGLRQLRPARRERWMKEVSTIAAYRDRWHISGQNPVGKPGNTISIEQTGQRQRALCRRDSGHSHQRGRARTAEQSQPRGRCRGGAGSRTMSKRKDAKALARWDDEARQWATASGRDLALDLYYNRRDGRPALRGRGRARPRRDRYGPRCRSGLISTGHRQPSPASTLRRVSAPGWLPRLGSSDDWPMIGCTVIGGRTQWVLASTSHRAARSSASTSITNQP